MADISQIQLPNGDTYDLVDEKSGYITSYTETDPIFSASAAAGITSSDITNWNAKVSDDKTWNEVTLNKQTSSPTWDIYIPYVGSVNNNNAYLGVASTTPTANYIVKYDSNSYLYSTTPSANDNSTKVATTAYVDSAITALPEPMIFKGSLGTGGTITTLPTAAASNEGYTYKVITAGTYASQEAKVGDTFISDGSSWVLIPSGDEPSGTVTSVGLSNATNGGLSISDSPVTSSGTITIGHSNVLTSAQTTQAVYPIKIDKNGHISEYGSAVTIPTVPTQLVGTTLNTTPTQVATALANNRNVEITHVDSTYGTGKTYNFYKSESMDVISSTALVLYGSNWLSLELYGDLTNDTWAVHSTTLAKASDIPTVPTITLNGSATTSPSFYAPTTAGTNGYVLKSNGSGAPTWTSAILTDEKVKQESRNGSNGVRNLLLTSSLGSTDTTTSTVAYARYLTYNDYDQTLTLTNISDSTKKVYISSTTIGIKTGSYTISLQADTQTANHLIYLPDAGGTLALTDDIPTRGTPTSGGTTLSLVNTGDMYTWNNKQDALVSGTNIKTINNTSLLGSGDITIVSDDHKWAGVELASTGAATSTDQYVPAKNSMGNTSGTANWLRATTTPDSYYIAKYDSNARLNSTDMTSQEVSNLLANLSGSTGASSTSTPTALAISKFDADACMNSSDMSAQDVSNFVGGLNITSIHAVDYVIEEGTDNGWEYRKWANGEYDAWQNYSSSVAIDTVDGSLYKNSTAIQIDLPSFQVVSGKFNVHGAMNGALEWVVFSGFSTSERWVSFFIMRTAQRSAQARAVHLSVHGKWK